MNPAVSVILPTRDRLPRLQQALAALAEQVPRAAEIIVIDDASRDGTSQWLKEWAGKGPGRVALAGAGRGPAAARNLGIRAAAGEIIAMTDDDCLPEPGWLAALAGALSDPAVAGAGGRTLPLHPENLFSRYQEQVSLGRPHQDPAGISLVITNNAAFRRTALLEIGGFNESHAFAGEDVDLSRRLRAAGHRLVFAPDARLRHHNISDWRGFLRVAWKTGQGEAILERRGAGWYKLLRTAWWGRRLFYGVLIPLRARDFRRQGRSCADAWAFAGLWAIDQAVRWAGVLSQWRWLLRTCP